MSRNKSENNLAFPRFPRDVELKSKSTTVIESDPVEETVAEVSPFQIKSNTLAQEELPIPSGVEVLEIIKEPLHDNLNPQIFLEQNLDQNILAEEAVNKVTNEICKNETTIKVLAKLISDELVERLDKHQQLNFIKTYSNLEMDLNKLEFKQSLEGFTETLSKAFAVKIQNMVNSISNHSSWGN